MGANRTRWRDAIHGGEVERVSGGGGEVGRVGGGGGGYLSVTSYMEARWSE